MNFLKDFASIIASVGTIIGFFIMFYLFRNNPDQTITNNFLNIMNFILGSACATLFNHIPQKNKDEKL